MLALEVGENESSKYWLGVLNELKNRGVSDIMVMCADGLTCFKEAASAAFPNSEYQRCVVHQVRNTLKYVPYKDTKQYANNLKTIYLVPTEKQGLEAMKKVKAKWEGKYPNSMKSWEAL